MKYLFLIASFAFLAACNVADKKETPQEKQAREEKEKKTEASMKDTANYTTIQWLDSTTQTLPPLKSGAGKVEITWKFKNTGNTPLIIEDVQPTCGCTIAEKPTEPVSPGEQGIIRATYNNETEGHVEKHLNVLANIKNHNNGNSTSIGFIADAK